MTGRDAVIAGAGIGGLTAGVALAQQGWRVTVLERAEVLEPVGAGLGLAPNAVRALDAIGLGDAVRKFSAIQGTGGLRRPNGPWLVHTDLGAVATRFGDPELITLRADLVDLLVAHLPAGALRTGVTVTSVDAGAAGSRARVATSAGELTADLVVAADGIGSRLRAGLFPGQPSPRYSGCTAWRFLAPPPSDGSPVEPAETWGRGSVFGTMPLADGRVYCYATATVPPGVRPADGAAGEAAELERRFGRWHDPIPGLLSSVSAADILHDDVYWIADPPPAYHHGRVALLGDAAHAMTPHLGQGACQAIEDAVVLASVAGPATAGTATARTATARTGAPDLAAYTAARMRRTRRLAVGSYRAGRVAQLTSRPAIALRDTAITLAGRLAPGLMIRQFDQTMSWTPPDLPAVSGVIAPLRLRGPALAPFP